jgi:hypothetical protein
MARSTTRSNQRPDTLMQDRSPPARRNHLQRTAGPYIGVKNGSVATFAINGKSGSDPSDERALLKRVSEIVETHMGKALSKGKPETDFAREFCKLADPQIGPGAIKLALENLRARIAAEKSSNPG